MTRSTYTKIIPSSTRYLEEVRRFVEAHALAAHLPVSTVEQFKVAVDEACTNVIKHAYHGEDGHRIEVVVVVKPDRFTVCIRDEGDAFDREAYEEPDLLRIARRRRGGGLGVHLMRRLMDHVEYQSHDRLNEVRLTKYRTSNATSGDGRA